MLRIIASCICLSVCLNAGCSSTICGEGTLEKGGVCVAPDDTVRCGPGFRVDGNRCLPEDAWIKNYCDPETTELRNGQCVGVGGGPPPVCAERCKTPVAGKTCVQGRAFLFQSLVVHGEDGATAVLPGEKRFIRVYDPFAFLIHPNPTPLAEGPIGAKGCFVIDGITPTLSGALAAIVEDDTDADAFIRFAMGVQAKGGEATEEVSVGGLSKTAADAWGEDLLSLGALMMWFRDSKTGANTPGVIPTSGSGVKPPFPSGDVFFLNASADGLAKTATSTTPSGIAIVRQAPVSQYGGSKASCTIDSVLSGSAPGALLLMPWAVQGCQP